MKLKIIIVQPVFDHRTMNLPVSSILISELCSVMRSDFEKGLRTMDQFSTWSGSRSIFVRRQSLIPSHWTKPVRSRGEVLPPVASFTDPVRQLVHPDGDAAASQPTMATVHSIVAGVKPQNTSSYPLTLIRKFFSVNFRWQGTGPR